MNDEMSIDLIPPFSFETIIHLAYHLILWQGSCFEILHNFLSLNVKKKAIFLLILLYMVAVVNGYIGFWSEKAVSIKDIIIKQKCRVDQGPVIVFIILELNRTTYDVHCAVYTATMDMPFASYYKKRIHLYVFVRWLWLLNYLVCSVFTLVCYLVYIFFLQLFDHLPI